MDCSTISQPRRELLRLIESIGFGRIENLTIRSGDPVLDPMPDICHDRKFGMGAGAKDRRIRDTGVMKNHVKDFLSDLDSFKDATVLYLDIQDGLPSKMRIKSEV